MNKKYLTKAIILYTRNFREADKIVTAFTKEKGLVTFVAKGVRKIKSKNRGLVRPFTYSDLELIEGKSMDTLAQGILIESFIRLQQDFLKIAYASAAGEFLCKALPEREPQVDLCYKYLLYLNLLDKSEADIKTATLCFFIQAIELLGYGPEMEVCNSCNKPLTQDGTYIFSNNEGGIICQDCLLPPDGEQVSLSAIEAYRSLKSVDFKKRIMPDIRKADLLRLEYLLDSQLAFLLERENKSFSFIKKIKDIELF